MDDFSDKKIKIRFNSFSLLIHACNKLSETFLSQLDWLVTQSGDCIILYIIQITHKYNRNLSGLAANRITYVCIAQWERLYGGRSLTSVIQQCLSAEELLFSRGTCVLANQTDVTLVFSMGGVQSSRSQSIICTNSLQSSLPSPSRSASRRSSSASSSVNLAPYCVTTCKHNTMVPSLYSSSEHVGHQVNQVLPEGKFQTARMLSIKTIAQKWSNV